LRCGLEGHEQGEAEGLEVFFHIMSYYVVLLMAGVNTACLMSGAPTGLGYDII
jgi:hypothetical protein